MTIKNMLKINFYGYDTSFIFNQKTKQQKIAKLHSNLIFPYFSQTQKALKTKYYIFHVLQLLQNIYFYLNIYFSFNIQYELSIHTAKNINPCILNYFQSYKVLVVFSDSERTEVALDFRQTLFYSAVWQSDIKTRSSQCQTLVEPLATHAKTKKIAILKKTVVNQTANQWSLNVIMVIATAIVMGINLVELGILKFKLNLESAPRQFIIGHVFHFQPN